jgi:cytochrome c oxidase cbb3-type subunit 3
MNWLSGLPLLQNSAPASAPKTSLGPLGTLSDQELIAFGIMSFVLLLGFFTIIRLAFKLMAIQRARINGTLGQPTAAAMADAEPPVSITKWLREWYGRMNDAVPVQAEAAIVLDHEYDGVRELDNNLPPWWKGLFYVTIAFAPIYLYVTQFADFSQSSAEEYEAEITLAEAKVRAYLATQQNTVDETNVELLADATALGQGQALFTAKCSPCHGKAGEGGIGPNLTDAYWIHGGDIKDVFRTIKYGVPEKGMIPWKNELRPRAMQEIASYIMTLQGTDPAGGKEPEGERYPSANSK